MASVLSSYFVFRLFSDDPKMLHAAEVEFLKNPENAHRFPKPTDAEEVEEEEPEASPRQEKPKRKKVSFATTNSC